MSESGQLCSFAAASGSGGNAPESDHRGFQVGDDLPERRRRLCAGFQPAYAVRSERF
jgi:hypothetical protein